MNSQEFRTAARTTFALAMDAYYAVSNDNDATMDALIAADVAKTAADAQWIADQHTANTMAQAELDAATAKGCEEVVEVVSAEVATPTAAQTAEESIIQWKAEKIAEKFYAKWRAGEATDADVAEYHNRFNTAKGCEEVVEVVSAEVATPTAAEVKAAAESIAYTLTDAGHLVPTFGIAWGADGQVLTNTETAEAIAKGDGWFDRQGRWVNKAGWEKQHSAKLSAWLTAKLAE
mgnify:CR=1 FL=1|tara:strand:- start:588 stop:1286 length:699 start_codon:yes stop_codon:yes gene_type:complete